MSEQKRSYSGCPGVDLCL